MVTGGADRRRLGGVVGAGDGGIIMIIIVIPGQIAGNGGLGKR
jgi:hypothetical protein